MNINTHYKTTSAVIIIFVFMAIFLFGTDPNSLPLPLIIAPFVLLFLVLYIIAQVLVRRFLPKTKRSLRRGLGIIVAGLPVMLLVLESIGQLTARDFFIVIGLISLLVYYFRKTDFLI